MNLTKKELLNWRIEAQEQGVSLLQLLFQSKRYVDSIEQKTNTGTLDTFIRNR